MVYEIQIFCAAVRNLPALPLSHMEISANMLAKIVQMSYAVLNVAV